jgi:hypothetical protein
MPTQALAPPLSQARINHLLSALDTDIERTIQVLRYMVSLFHYDCTSCSPKSDTLPFTNEWLSDTQATIDLYDKTVKYVHDLECEFDDELLEYCEEVVGVFASR